MPPAGTSQATDDGDISPEKEVTENPPRLGSIELEIRKIAEEMALEWYIAR